MSDKEMPKWVEDLVFKSAIKHGFNLPKQPEEKFDTGNLEILALCKDIEKLISALKIAMEALELSTEVYKELGEPHTTSEYYRKLNAADALENIRKGEFE